MVKGEQAGVDAEYEAASEVVHRVLGILDIHLIGEGTMVNMVLEVVLLDLQTIPLHVRGENNTPWTNTHACEWCGRPGRHRANVCEEPECTNCTTSSHSVRMCPYNS